MAVTLQIPRIFRKYTGDKASLSFEARSRREVFEKAIAAYPALKIRVLDKNERIYPYLVLFHNGRSVDRDALDEPVEDGDVLDLITAAVGGSGPDVRMRGFQDRRSVDESLAYALDQAAPLEPEDIDLTTAAGRILAAAVVSDCAIPPFRRSAMDGYALRAEDSFGAGLYAPISLELIGAVLPGAAFEGAVGPGQAVRIMTGAPVPDGADAVLKAEESRESEGRVEALAAIAPGKNVGAIGEDIAAGDEVLAAGRRLRPQDIGVLASIGRARVSVIRRPRVRIIATGDELLAPGQRPGAGKIVDSNSPMLAALIARDGGDPTDQRRLPDVPDQIRAALSAPGADIIIASGGTSVGQEDWLPVLVRELGELGVHGIAMRPCAPTGLGRIASARVFLLPGNPVSCLAAYDLFAAPLLRRLGGRPIRDPYPRVTRALGRRVVSQIGRVDYVRVRLENGLVYPIAAAGASILSSTTRADGYIVTPEGSEGLPEGASVEVALYDLERAEAR